MRGHTCYGSEVFGDTYQRSIVFAHALLLGIIIQNYTIMTYIFIFIAVLAVIYFITSSSINKKREEIINKYGNPTWNSSDKIGFLLYDNKQKIIIYGQTIDYKDIIDFSINNEISYKKTISMGGTITKGIIGGLLFGGVGAIIGASTASSKISQDIKEYKFNITINNINNPYIIYETQSEEDAKRIAATLKIIIDKQKKEN